MGADAGANVGADAGTDVGADAGVNVGADPTGANMDADTTGVNVGVRLEANLGTNAGAEKVPMMGVNQKFATAPAW